uniref:Kazal-like domain-containing protein n=1 Tax=Gopherus evgoodei TaxID=1825980 RepID=A0A8C4W364_9SAUR
VSGAGIGMRSRRKEPDCGSYILPGCPKILDPVCGTDSETYPNECELCRCVKGVKPRCSNTSAAKKIRCS